MKGVKKMKAVKPVKVRIFFIVFMSFRLFMVSSFRYRPEPGTVCRSLFCLVTIAATSSSSFFAS